MEKDDKSVTLLSAENFINKYEFFNNSGYLQTNERASIYILDMLNIAAKTATKFLYSL